MRFRAAIRESRVNKWMVRFWGFVALAALTGLLVSSAWSSPAG